eukprot:5220975-Prymnesium_polylepis.1
MRAIMRGGGSPTRQELGDHRQRVGARGDPQQAEHVGVRHLPHQANLLDEGAQRLPRGGMRTRERLSGQGARQRWAPNGPSGQRTRGNPIGKPDGASPTGHARRGKPDAPPCAGMGQRCGRAALVWLGSRGVGRAPC